ncbi:hypothetical protein FQN54_001775 [Arachnomyces sp. PD_36]|nr:hypothetical protein FQN54_001775 [Arachnomyces sp. PD_36]
MAILTRSLLLSLWLLSTTAVASTVHTLTSSDRTRSYWVHEPDEFDESKTYPVVLAFHGSSHIGVGFDGAALELDIRLSLPIIPTDYSADRFFVYPNGEGGAWAGPTYGEVSVDEDLQFINDLLADLKSEYEGAIDSNRIYATGFSNGGGFVATLACDEEVGGQFAAFAPVAGSFYTDVNGTEGSCNPARSPLPILEIHGGVDDTVFYDGGEGEGGPLPAISDWLGYWQERNGCTSDSTSDSDGGNVHHTTWTCNGVEGALQHWKVDENGHNWPSKTINLNMAVSGFGPQPIEANDIVTEFFDSFSLDT